VSRPTAPRLVAALLLALTLAGAGAHAAGLVAHRAVYDMRRASASIESDVVGVQGRMEVNVEASCDGWRLEQFLGFRVMDGDGGVYEHLARLEGFESREGREYWFNTKTWEDRRLTEELAGVARVDPGEGPGRVRLSKPEAQTIALPPGTLFPTGHIAALVDAASAGERRLRRTVYDGSTLESPYEISAAIGARRAGADGRFDALEDAAAWPVHLAYFPVSAVEPAPDFQMEVLLYENGVAGDMVYDYGTFTVAVRLETLELLPTPSCP